MADIDFDALEDELDIVVPDIYRMFIEAVNANDYQLQHFGIYHTTSAVLRGNHMTRLRLGKGRPKWKDQYFDFGVSDGCDNLFFLQATDQRDDLVQLWAHDPPGIEDVSTATDFFTSLLSELACGFTGPDRLRFDGNGPIKK